MYSTMLLIHKCSFYILSCFSNKMYSCEMHFDLHEYSHLLINDHIPSMVMQITLNSNANVWLLCPDWIGLFWTWCEGPLGDMNWLIVFYYNFTIVYLFAEGLAVLHRLSILILFSIPYYRYIITYLNFKTTTTKKSNVTFWSQKL